jgi:hypothetical protein
MWDIVSSDVVRPNFMQNQKTPQAMQRRHTVEQQSVHIVLVRLTITAFLLMMLMFKKQDLAATTCCCHGFVVLISTRIPATSRIVPPQLLHPNVVHKAFTAVSRTANTTSMDPILDRDDDENDYIHAVSMEENSFDRKWNFMFKKLKEYKDVHGDCLVNVLYQCDDGTPLGRWVAYQRSQFLEIKDVEMREQRQQALDSIGFVWIVKERNRQLPSPADGLQHASTKERFNARWNVMFEKLKEYKSVHSHCRVPIRYKCPDGTPLGAWVSTQRRQGSSDSEISVQHRKALDDIGFVWQAREPVYTRDDQWNEMFQLLQAYYDEHGDCLVPSSYVTKDTKKKRLGNWVKVQRCRLASGKLYEDRYKDRLQQLQTINFTWRASPEIDARWHHMFERLVEYRKIHGDCLVPTLYPEYPAFGDWVNNLRARRPTLSHDQLAQLESIDFVWNTHAAKWNDLYEQLRRYHAMYGDCHVPSHYDPRLAQWVHRQRRRLSSKQLKPNRQAKLGHLGFFG